jgi:hypothetical protein
LVTSYLDGSQIYGSDNGRNYYLLNLILIVTASALRTFSGGLLKTTILNGLELPPLNTLGIPIANDAHIVNVCHILLINYSNFILK